MDMVRLRDDIEAFRHDERKERRQQDEPRRVESAFVARMEGSREKHIHRKVVIPPRHNQNGRPRTDTEWAARLADSCGVGEEVSRVVSSGAQELALPRGTDPYEKHATGARNGDDPERQSPGSQSRGESRSVAGHDEPSPRHEVDGSSEQQQQPYASSGQRAMGLWRKTLRRMESTIYPPKDANQAQQHPSEDAREDRVIGNGDEQGWSKTNSWTVWGLLRRVQRSSSPASDPNQWRQQHVGESDESGYVMNNSEQFATSVSASPERLNEPEPEKEHGVDIGDGEQQQSVWSESDDQSQPGSGMQDVRGRCDKSICRYCKGKGVEGRGGQSPCRATNACATTHRVIPR